MPIQNNEMEAEIRRDVNVNQADQFKSTIRGDLLGIWFQGAKDQDISDGNHNRREKVPPLYHATGFPSPVPHVGKREVGSCISALRILRW